jgi:hypothetical protein
MELKIKISQSFLENIPHFFPPNIRTRFFFNKMQIVFLFMLFGVIKLAESKTNNNSGKTREEIKRNVMKLFY